MKTNACVVCGGKEIDILFTHHGNLKMGKCRSCGLVQVVPMLTPVQIAALYHEDFDHFDPYIEQLAVHHQYFRRVMQDVILAYAKIGIGTRNVKTDSRLRGNDNRKAGNDNRKAGNDNRKAGNDNRKAGNDKSLLDIGCLTGVLLEEAKAAGWKSTGIDISRDAVTYCRKHGLTVYNGTVYTARELKEKFFDVITAFQIIEHERDPLKMMRRIHNLLKDDGMVILATPNYGGFWQKVMGKRWFGFAHPEHVVLLDFNSMRVLLEKAGFRDIEIRADSPRPFSLSFALTRAADYFPWAVWFLKPLGKLFDHFDIKNPINPWDDMIAFARK